MRRVRARAGCQNGTLYIWRSVTPHCLSFLDHPKYSFSLVRNFAIATYQNAIQNDFSDYDHCRFYYSTTTTYKLEPILRSALSRIQSSSPKSKRYKLLTSGMFLQNVPLKEFISVTAYISLATATGGLIQSAWVSTSSLVYYSKQKYYFVKTN